VSEKKAGPEADLGAVDYRVQVAYTVPVEVVVDPRRGTVDRVVVVDEEVELDRREGARKETWLTPVPSAVAERAIEIAERAEVPGWPRWEFGF
jgi:hypothetical protein